MSQGAFGLNELRSFAPHVSLRVPVRVRGPVATLETLRRSPLVKACRAHRTRVERVPHVATGTKPAVVLARRPTAEWAPDAWAGRIDALSLIRLAINNNRRFGGVI